MLRLLLRSVVKQGTLTVIRPGATDRFGQGAPHVTVRLADDGVASDIGRDPDLALGEAYMDGRLVVEEGGIEGLLDLLMSNVARNRSTVWHRLGRALRGGLRAAAQYNPVGRAKAHVAYHYDLSGKLYDLFLDKDRQYSCAYFSAPGETLDEAQIGKKRHIAAKLFMHRPGLSVLDIGCGWGGLALDLARDLGAEVLGITLSEEQLAGARRRAADAGQERCRFELTDYRMLAGRFDRIVSVGMFEHVGVPYYRRYFDSVARLLAEDGVALIHFIGRSDGPGHTNPWIAKYIFPGGYTPALSEVLPVVEASGLIVSDIEVLRLHYAETLKEWLRRVRQNWQALAALYDERFCRMWEFYLAGAEMGFRREGLVVYQIQLVKRMDALPLTRDYMVDDERTMKFAGTEQMPRARRAA